MILERDLVVFKGDLFVPANGRTPVVEHRATGYTRCKGYVMIVGPPPVGLGPHLVLEQGYGSCEEPSPYSPTDKDVFSGVLSSGVAASPVDLAVNDCCGWALKNLTGTNFVARVCLILSVFPSQFD